MTEPSTKFRIDDTEGILLLAQELDYEVEKHFLLTVDNMDPGSPFLLLLCCMYLLDKSGINNITASDDQFHGIMMFPRIMK